MKTKIHDQLTMALILAKTSALMTEECYFLLPWTFAISKITCQTDAAAVVVIIVICSWYMKHIIAIYPHVFPLSWYEMKPYFEIQTFLYFRGRSAVSAAWQQQWSLFGAIYFIHQWTPFMAWRKISTLKLVVLLWKENWCENWDWDEWCALQQAFFGAPLI